MLDPDEGDDGDQVMARTIIECVCVSECNHETMLGPTTATMATRWWRVRERGKRKG